MSFGQIFKNFRANDEGEVINRFADVVFVSHHETTYTQVRNNVIGGNGSHFVQAEEAANNGISGRRGRGSMIGGLDTQPATWFRSDGLGNEIGRRKLLTTEMMKCSNSNVKRTEAQNLPFVSFSKNP